MVLSANSSGCWICNQHKKKSQNKYSERKNSEVNGKKMIYVFLLIILRLATVFSSERNWCVCYMYTFIRLVHTMCAVCMFCEWNALVKVGKKITSVFVKAFYSQHCSVFCLDHKKALLHRNCLGNECKKTVTFWRFCASFHASNYSIFIM